MLPFSIQTQLTLKAYNQITYKLLYLKPLIIICSLTGAVWLIIFGLCYTSLCHYLYPLVNSDWFGYGAAFPTIAILSPATLWIKNRYHFSSNLRLNEPMVFNFRTNSFDEVGQTFNSTFDWSKIHKVRTFKNWLIIYHSRFLANLIMVKPEDGENIDELKNWLKTNVNTVRIK